MSEISGAAVSGTMILEELDGGSAGGEQASPPDPGPLHCGRCALWPRPQTWLCVVPLLIGFIGLGLSLMLLNWIVVGSVQDYVPTDLVDAKGIGQDPIFLSKPSAVPKNPHTTTSSGNPTVKIRPRPGIHPSVTPSTAPSTAPSRRTPHLHNRISTRLTTTTTHAPRQPPPAGRDVAPHSTTVHRVGSGSGRNAAPSSTRAAPPNASSSPYNHPLLQNSTHTWNHEHSSKGPSDTPTRPHLHVKTVAPTSPSLRSEHFKPCRDKDLAYCLNEGECFVIQTLTGSHKHCRCKEGYQGIRCDQFLPKTDSISSDPNHLGIEFMESKEVYKRQVLSISCITIGISLLGTLCIALYCQNKRRREKLQAHLKVSCSLKNPNVGFAPALTSKSSLRLQYGLQFQKHCKDPGFTPPHGGAVCGSNSCPAPPTHPKAPTTRKQSRSRSLSNSPGQKNRAPHHLTASRRTPPISRGRLNPIGGSRDSSHAYQHLQEVEGSEVEVQPLTRCNCSTVGSDPLQEEHFDMQQGERGEDRWGHAGMQFSRLDRATPLHQAPPPSLRACSVPIIPSFQGHDVTSCMQKNSPGRETCSPEGGASSQGTHPPAYLTEVGSSGPRSDWEEEPRDGPWALPHTYREQEDKTDSLLLPAGSRAEGEAQKELSENQLVDYCGPAQHSKDCSQLCQ